MFGLGPFWFWMAVATLMIPFAAFLLAWLIVRPVFRSPIIRAFNFLEKWLP
jgi:hypothetical protein